jgi:hypothetical protein
MNSKKPFYFSNSKRNEDENQALFEETIKNGTQTKIFRY